MTSKQVETEAHVLVIDDDDDTRETMQLFLELKGYRVLAARHGREGLQVLEEHGKVGLILLDWMMPVMNGREFLDTLGEHPQFGEIPVLVITAFSGHDRSVPEHHLKKPVCTADLLRAIDVHCSCS